MKRYVIVDSSEFCGTFVRIDLGVFLNHDEAFEQAVAMNQNVHPLYPVYEEDYGEDEWPVDDEELNAADEANDWKKVEELLEKHIVTDPREVTRLLEKWLAQGYDVETGYATVREIEVRE